MFHVYLSHASVRIWAPILCTIPRAPLAAARPVGAGFGLLLVVAVLAVLCPAPVGRCASPDEGAGRDAHLASRALGQDPGRELAHRGALSADVTLPPASGPAIAIASIVELQKIGNDAAYPINGCYYLSQDIDASDTANWNDVGTDESLLEGFRPIGYITRAFAGVFDGQGHAITGLVIHRPTAYDVGLFGVIGPSAVIRNVAIVDGSVTGVSEVGALLGANNGFVEECSSTSTVIGGGEYVGCLIGHNYATVSRCYAKGNVTASNGLVGGLVGCSDVLLSCCASDSTVTATGNSDGVGGLTGRNWTGGTVSQCYATGPVFAPNGGAVGGLIGLNNTNTDLVIECYATGRVSASGPSAGGFLGQSPVGAVVTSCFWDTQASGQATSAGGATGLTTVAMRKRATYVGWDFSNTWTIQEGASYPRFVFSDVPPSRPTNLLPANAARRVCLTPVFAATAFVDADDGDTHLASQWQLRRGDAPADFSVILYDTGVTTQSLTSCPLPPGVLAFSTDYGFRVRYSDRAEKWSAWSVPTFFRTKDLDRSAAFVLH